MWWAKLSWHLLCPAVGTTVWYIISCSMSCSPGPILIPTDPNASRASALSMHCEWHALLIHHLDSAGHLCGSKVSSLPLVENNCTHPRRGWPSLHAFCSGQLWAFPLPHLVKCSFPSFQPARSFVVRNLINITCNKRERVRSLDSEFYLRMWAHFCNLDLHIHLMNSVGKFGSRCYFLKETECQEGSSWQGRDRRLESGRD